MSVLFADNWALVANGNGAGANTASGWNATGSGTSNVNSTGGPFSDHCLEFVSSSTIQGRYLNTNTFTANTWGGTAHAGISTHVNLQRAINSGAGNSYYPVLGWGSTGTMRLTLWYSRVDKKFRLTTGGTNPAIPTSTTTLGDSNVLASDISAAWHHVEAIILESDTVGTCRVWVDGVLEMNLTNIDTEQGVIQNPILMSGYIASGDRVSHSFANFVAHSGSSPIGPCRVQTLFPTSDVITQWPTFSTGSSAWDLVDENGSDGDTTYVQSSTTVTDRLSFTFQDLGREPDTIHAVGFHASEKPQAQNGSAVGVFFQQGGGTFHEHTFTGSTLTSAYAVDIPSAAAGWWATNPSNGNPWNEAEVNSVVGGIRSTSNGSGSRTMRLSNFGLVVVASVDDAPPPPPPGASGGSSLLMITM